jgi:hypothetical protein
MNQLLGRSQHINCIGDLVGDVALTLARSLAQKRHCCHCRAGLGSRSSRTGPFPDLRFCCQCQHSQRNSNLQNRSEQRPCSGGFDSRPPPLTDTRTNRGHDEVRLDAGPRLHQDLLHHRVQQPLELLGSPTAAAHSTLRRTPTRTSPVAIAGGEDYEQPELAEPSRAPSACREISRGCNCLGDIADSGTPSTTEPTMMPIAPPVPWEPKRRSTNWSARRRTATPTSIHRPACHGSISASASGSRSKDTAAIIAPAPNPPRTPTTLVGTVTQQTSRPATSSETVRAIPSRTLPAWPMASQSRSRAVLLRRPMSCYGPASSRSDESGNPTEAAPRRCKPALTAPTIR